MPTLIFVLFWLGLAVGWVMNIVQVVGLALANAEFTTTLILKIVGIPFGPLGAVLGWVTLFN